MGLVEDDRVARGQKLGEPLVAKHDVGEEEMMVDDDDIRLQRVLARLHHEALAIEAALAAEAVFARRRDQRPDRSVLRHVGELAAVAALRRPREGDDLRQVTRILARRQPTFARRPLEVMVADVIGAALEQRDRDRQAQRIADHRHVALVELVLQRLRAGRDDHLAAVEQRGHEVRERLAGAGTGLGDQATARRDRLGDRLGHRQLLLAKREARQSARKRTADAEDRAELRRGNRPGGVRFGPFRRVEGRSGQRGAFSRAAWRTAGFAAAVARITMTDSRIASLRSAKSAYTNPVRTL